eukprot:scaffold36592_cov56-Phaeocystis_antarctica.AAC.1
MTLWAPGTAVRGHHVATSRDAGTWLGSTTRGRGTHAIYNILTRPAHDTLARLPGVYTFTDILTESFSDVRGWPPSHACARTTRETAAARPRSCPANPRIAGGPPALPPSQRAAFSRSGFSGISHHRVRVSPDAA